MLYKYGKRVRDCFFWWGLGGRAGGGGSGGDRKTGNFHCRLVFLVFGADFYQKIIPHALFRLFVSTY